MKSMIQIASMQIYIASVKLSPIKEEVSLNIPVLICTSYSLGLIQILNGSWLSKLPRSSTTTEKAEEKLVRNHGIHRL